MKLASFKSFGVASLLCAIILVPAVAQKPGGTLSAQSRRADVPFSAVIEAIEFNGVSAEMQKAALDRIGLRVGDMLTGEARQRIGRELNKVQKGMTFTYTPGRNSGTAKLIISADC
jgi:hypothetical protein